MGSGSTVAACEAIGFTCIGVERRDDYYQLARIAVSRLRDVMVERDARQFSLAL
jgi:site-specific DNA-methyltransferase (adenine-specific)